jgi:uncharacterized repeat protein (TIGR02543 family)
MDADKSVTAKFSVGTITYTVDHNGNGSTGGMVPTNKTKNQGVSLTLATNSGGLVKTDHIFVGWNTEADGSGTDYAEGATYVTDADLTLFAKWTQPQTYTVSYDGNGHTGGTVPANQTKTHGVDLTLDANSGGLAKTGYIFAGWNTAANGGGADYATGATHSTDADLTLFAKWTSASGTWTKIDDTDPTITYTPAVDWALESHAGCYQDTYHENGDQGASASYTFTGTRVRVYVFAEGSPGIAKVLIDGSPVGTIDYRSLDGGDLLAFTSAKLSSGTHAISIVNSSGVVLLDALEYLAGGGDTDPPSAPTRLGATAGDGQVGHGAAEEEPKGEKTRIACVGDSITFGATIENRKENCYPARLGRLLGAKDDVGNFGNCGATALETAEFPYTKTADEIDGEEKHQYNESLRFEPHIVVIMLGINDTCPDDGFWNKEQYIKDYTSLVKAYKGLKTRPQIYVCYPTPAFRDAKWDGLITKEVIPALKAIARKLKCTTIDLHTPFAEDAGMFPDRIHSNAEGARKMAGIIKKAIITRGSSSGEDDDTARGRRSRNPSSVEGCGFDSRSPSRPPGSTRPKTGPGAIPPADSLLQALSL